MTSPFDARSLSAHKKKRGKLGVQSLLPLAKASDLSLLYTPGVAAVSRAIAEDPARARTLTLAGRTVAVVSDGSAVLGLGNIGPHAALPVMEGKAIIFKEFAGLDAFPIVLNTQDADAIVATVKAIAPTFAAINLEDIAAPRCFAVEERLKAELDIPVMHDDQHGTAIVVLAALQNAVRATKRTMSDLSIVIAGAGAAAIATIRLLLQAGVSGEKIIVLDSKGSLLRARTDLSAEKRIVAERTNGRGYVGGLRDALRGADVFIGMSRGGTLPPEWIQDMADRPIIFALANPDPEIPYAAARTTKAAIIGTGRSDYPNQINNALVFPGVFRGAIDAGATKITDGMKIAAAKAIGGLVPQKDIMRGIVVPGIFDKRVVPAVARAVKNEWKKYKISSQVRSAK